MKYRETAIKSLGTFDSEWEEFYNWLENLYPSLYKLYVKERGANVYGVALDTGYIQHCRDHGDYLPTIPDLKDYIVVHEFYHPIWLL